MNPATHTSESHQVNSSHESNSSSKTTTNPLTSGQTFPQGNQGFQGNQGIIGGNGSNIGSGAGVGATSSLPGFANSSQQPSSGFGSSTGVGSQPAVAISHGTGTVGSQGQSHGHHHHGHHGHQHNLHGSQAAGGAAGGATGALAYGAEDAVKGGHASSQGISARGPGNNVSGAPDYDSRTTAVQGVNDPVATAYGVHGTSTNPGADVAEKHPNPTHVSNQFRPGTTYNTAPVAGDGAQLHGGPPPAYKENINSSVNLPQHKPI